VAVRMVGIRHMRMRVPPWLVTMSVAVCPGGHQVMHMLVVPVVMAACVFVLRRFVFMLVSV
jgi:hypothetical protein